MAKKAARKAGNKNKGTTIHIDPGVKAVLKDAAKIHKGGVLSRFLVETAIEEAKTVLGLTQKEFAERVLSYTAPPQQQD